MGIMGFYFIFFNEDAASFIAQIIAATVLQDDESTLEQQELVEAAENQPNQYKKELNTLAGEAILPLDEILRSYGVVVTPDCRVKHCSTSLSTEPGDTGQEEIDAKETDMHNSSALKSVKEELESSRDGRAHNTTAALFDPGGRSGEPIVPLMLQKGHSKDSKTQSMNTATGLQVLLDEKDGSDEEFLADMMDVEDEMVSVWENSCSALRYLY